MKESARRLAAQGYVALTVDLYRGHTPADAEEGHELMRSVPEDRARRDLQATFDFLNNMGRVDPQRIGAIGWCMGGGFSLVGALSLPELRSAVVCYGGLAEDRDALDGIQASVLGIFGGQDRDIPVESVRCLESTLWDLGKNAEIHVYPKSGHAFMNSNNARGYNAEDAAEAWLEIDGFFKRTLRSSSDDT